MELLHFDIETVGQYKDFKTFEENDERGSSIFKNKCLKSKWDIEHSSIEEAYLQKSPIISTYGKIVCISVGFKDKGEFRISSLYSDNEKDVVDKFNNLLKKIEVKDFNLSGYRILYFDIPWVMHKLHKYGIEPASILSIYGKKPWEMRVVDIAEDWKQKFAWTSSFDEVCYELGIDSPKSDLNGSEVHSAYWNGDIEKIKTYCENDVRASLEVADIIYKIF